MNEKPIHYQFPQLTYVGIAVLSILLISKITFLVCTFDKGLDISDEGMHLLMFKYPTEYAITIHNYQFMVTALLSPSEITVFNLRLCWLLSDLVGWLVLFAGSIAFLQNYINISKSTAVLFFLTGGNAIALSIHDRMIAYNTFSNLFMNISSGLLLAALSRNGFNRYHRLLLIAVFFFIALELFIKPTAAIGVAGLAVILCLLFYKDKIGETFLLVLTGTVLGFAFMLLFVLPPLDIWIPNYLKGVELAHTSGYGSKIMLLYLYAIPTVLYLVFMLLANSPSLVLLKWLVRKNLFTGYTSLFWLICGHLISSILFLLLLHLTSKKAFNFEILQNTSTAFYSLILLIPNTLCYQWFSARIGSDKTPIPSLKVRPVLVCLFLLAVPYLIVFGSFSALDVSLYGHILPLIVLLFIMPCLFMNYTLLYKLLAYYIIFTTVLCSYCFYRHYIQYPTRMLHPLYEQTVNAGNNETLLVDSEAGLFIGELKQKVKKAGNFKSAIQIGLQPGLLYFLDVKQPGNNFYLSVSITDDPEKIFGTIETMNTAYNDYFYNKYANEITQGPVLINEGVPKSDISALQKRMNEVGYNLFLIDSVFNPYLKREANGNPSVKQPFTYIYRPLKITR